MLLLFPDFCFFSTYKDVDNIISIVIQTIFPCSLLFPPISTFWDIRTPCHHFILIPPPLYFNAYSYTFTPWQDVEAAFIHASRIGHAAIVKTFLRAGADKDAQNIVSTLLVNWRGCVGEVNRCCTYVCMFSFSPKVSSTLTILPYLESGRTNLCKIFYGLGPSFSSMLEWQAGCSALILASQLGKLAAAKVLLQAGADKEVKDRVSCWELCTAG